MDTSMSNTYGELAVKEFPFPAAFLPHGATSPLRFTFHTVRPYKPKNTSIGNAALPIYLPMDRSVVFGIHAHEWEDAILNATHRLLATKYDTISKRRDVCRRSGFLQMAAHVVHFIADRADLTGSSGVLSHIPLELIFPQCDDGTTDDGHNIPLLTPKINTTSSVSYNEILGDSDSPVRYYLRRQCIIPFHIACLMSTLLDPNEEVPMAMMLQTLSQLAVSAERHARGYLHTRCEDPMSGEVHLHPKTLAVVTAEIKIRQCLTMLVRLPANPKQQIATMQAQIATMAGIIHKLVERTTTATTMTAATTTTSTTPIVLSAQENDTLQSLSLPQPIVVVPQKPTMARSRRTTAKRKRADCDSLQSSQQSLNDGVCLSQSQSLFSEASCDDLFPSSSNSNSSTETVLMTTIAMNSSSSDQMFSSWSLSQQSSLPPSKRQKVDIVNSATGRQHASTMLRTSSEPSLFSEDANDAF